MFACSRCGGPTSRRARGFVRRVFSRAFFRCDSCGAATYVYRSFFSLFQRWSHCPLCHNRRLTILARPDQVDRRTLNPFRRLLGLFGFPLYHCTFCRFQFRDWRRLDPRATMAEDAVKSRAAGSR